MTDPLSHFEEALRVEDPVAVADLLRSGVGADVLLPCDLTPVYYAAMRGRLDIVAMLLGAGADVNRPTASAGRLPLGAAASGGHVKVAEALLAHGARVNDADQHQRAPLHHAAQHNKRQHEAMIHLLVRHGADVNQGIISPPLFLGCQFGSVKVVAALIQAGAGLDTRTPCATPLIVAILARRLPVVQMLLDAGASPTLAAPPDFFDPELKDPNALAGLMPGEIARRLRLQNIAAALGRHGG